MLKSSHARGACAWAFGLAMLAGLATSSTSLAQSITETEPNDSIATANLLNNVSATDGNHETITGGTTGSSTTVAGTTSADYFRVKVADAAPGIYRYRMELTTGAAAAFTPTLRGRDVTTGPLLEFGESTTALQTGASTTTPQRYVQWYGFGEAEEVHYRLTGTAATTGGYVSQLKRLTITPTVIATSIPSGSVEITSIGQTSVDTAFIVLDSDYKPYGSFRNDDEGPSGPTTQSKATRSLVPGTYYIGISNGNLVKGVAAANDEDQKLDDIFYNENVLANSSTSSGDDLDFQVIGPATTASVSVIKSASFAIEWYQLTVTDSGNLVAFAETQPFAATQGASVTIKVRTSPSTGNTITSVSADLSLLGLPTLNLSNSGGGIWTGSFTMPQNTSAPAYMSVPVTVMDTGANSVNVDADFLVQPSVPTNDNCASAFDLNSVTFPYNTIVNNALATNDALNMGGCTSSTTSAGFGVWYKYMTGGTPTVLKIVDSQASQTAGFAVFEATNLATPCSTLTASLSCQDSQTAYFSLAANKLYYVVVVNDTSTATPDPDALMLEFSTSVLPTNDLCSGAIEMTSFPFQSGKVPQALLTLDTTDVGCGGSNWAQGMWYKFTPVADTILGFKGNTGSADIDVSVYTGPTMNPCSGLTFVECSQTATTTITYRFDTIAGNTYYFLVGDQTTTVSDGEYDFAVSVITPPANDTCATAETVSLTGGSVNTTAESIGANNDIDMDCNDGSLTSTLRGVWYTFTTGADAGSLAIADTSSLDITRQFYTGTCAALTPVFCDYDDTATVPLSANTQYYMLLSTYSTTPTTAYGLTWDFIPRTGACCTSGTCTEGVTRSACVGGGGVYQGDGVVCTGGNHAAESGVNITMFDAVTVPLIDETWRQLDVTQSGTITSVSVSVDLLHNAAGDIGITLKSPNNTVISLYDRTSTANLTTCPQQFVGASSEANLDGVFNFSDSATGTLRDAVFPLLLTGDVVMGGNFRTGDCAGNTTSLNTAFGGESMTGTWELRVVDNKNTDSGLLRGWSISFNGGLAPLTCATGPTPCQVADFDNNNAVSVNDLFVFLDAWFAQNGMSGMGLSADVDGNNAVSVNDLFVFLDLWFTYNGQSC